MKKLGVQMDVIEKWNGPMQLLLRGLSTIHKAYKHAYSKLSEDIKELFEKRHNDYLNSEGSGPLWHLLDYLLCMFPYRDLQYGFREPKDSENLKLGWIALHMAALQKLSDDVEELRHELESIGQFEDEDINFFINYISSTISELSAMYVYLLNDMVILPFGFMQHGIQIHGKSGPALGDFIEVTTLSFVDVKSSYAQVSPQELVNLMVSTRMPSAFIVPRYNLKEGKIDNSKIVLDRFEPLFIGKRKYPQMRKKRDYLSAPIKNEHTELISSIKLLKDNAEYLLTRG
jgi:hypothetical protein